MALLSGIRDKIADGLFEYSKHAVDQSIVRGIAVHELREAIAGGAVVEDYPDDRYGPSCLIGGRTAAGRSLHVQCSYPSRSLVRIITLYEPDPQRWTDLRTRRRS